MGGFPVCLQHAPEEQLPTSSGSHSRPVDRPFLVAPTRALCVHGDGYGIEVEMLPEMLRRDRERWGMTVGEAGQ